MNLDGQRSATRSHSSAGQAHFEAEPKENMPSYHEVAPSSSALGPLQVLQPSAKTVHLVGELLNATILLSPVCLTTVEKFPRRNMPDEEDFVILGIVLVGALHMAGFLKPSSMALAKSSDQICIDIFKGRSPIFVVIGSGFLD